MLAKTLMIQGTSSSVGKSLLVAGLCRLFARRGVKVAPFKAQNMSNNAAVCPDGSEIGRAQAVQAAAAFLEPTAQMNPILLKPEGHARSQVIVLGRALDTLSAAAFYQRKRQLWPVVTTALEQLRSRFELVIIEGAGSPVELNLAAGDIVNMAIARHAQAPVLLVGDIDRGGIFAQLLGTLWLLAPEERKLVKGLIVNKFRGDQTLFIDGVRILEKRGEAPVLGVIPFLNGLDLPEEDAVVLEHGTLAGECVDDVSLDLAIIRLPHIANFDDFDPLRQEPGMRVRYVSSVVELGRPDAIILPGTKTTMADLAWLRAQGLDRAIREHADAGTAVIGICGGYQMLGRSICDPEQVESCAIAASGLGLLPVDTVFVREKATYRVHGDILGGPGWLGDLAGKRVQGYEIHMGRTMSETSWLELRRESEPGRTMRDGASDEHGRVWGCYVHGLFANDDFRRTWLASVGWASGGRKPPGEGPCVSGGLRPPLAKTLDDALNRLADSLEQCLKMNLLENIIAES